MPVVIPPWIPELQETKLVGSGEHRPRLRSEKGPAGLALFVCIIFIRDEMPCSRLTRWSGRKTESREAVTSPSCARSKSRSTASKGLP